MPMSPTLTIISYLLMASLSAFAMSDADKSHDEGKPAINAAGSPCDWATPRHDAQLTARQPCSGKMRGAPVVLTRTAIAPGRAKLRPFASKPGGDMDRALALAHGALQCYEISTEAGSSETGRRPRARQGKLLWRSHPPGINFDTVSAIEDLDGDGRVEIAMMAGRPASPLGAAVLLDAATGKLLWRYDVEPMSYAWYFHIDQYLPEERRGEAPPGTGQLPPNFVGEGRGGGSSPPPYSSPVKGEEVTGMSAKRQAGKPSTQPAGKQLIVLMHGYPPDKLNGYMVMFEFPAPGRPPVQRWRYDFDKYTCFPSLLTSDVDGDGVKEICVETHSRMWVLDALSGKVKQFIQWDVSPANIRSYGLVKFMDLNGGGREDFLCIATFAQHHEVLLNENGKLKLAWAHGWDDSVTTSKIASTWPEAPVADVDGDGKLEVIVSMFNSQKDEAWKIRIYDAVTGALKLTIQDRIAVRVGDLDGDGTPEILSNITTDPTRANITGAALIKIVGGKPEEIWHQDGFRADPRTEALLVDSADKPAGRLAGKTYALSLEKEGVKLTEYTPPPKRRPDLSELTVPSGELVPAPLVKDLDADGSPARSLAGRAEIIHTWQGKVTIYRWNRKQGLTPIREHVTSGDPALADLDGDGKTELIVGEADLAHEPLIRALRADGSVLWESRLPPPNRPGLPHGRYLYFQVGRFTGKPTPDVYVLAQIPIVRSLVLDGLTGKLVWEKSEFPDIQRYYGPTVNLASVYDVDSDGADDLVFTNPDYYCVASGRTGELILGPAFPPNIFNQPSQGLYTLPAILEQPKCEQPSEPLVVLCSGHYFLAAMNLRAEPRWYQLPEAGQARCASEGFLRLPDGDWLIGFGRQNGSFACLDATTGKVRWELPIEASAGDVVSCDIDGDGNEEFIFGDSHGYLWAVRDASGKPASPPAGVLASKPKVVWKVNLGASIGSPVVADLDGDGRPEITVPTGDGCLAVIGNAESRQATLAPPLEKDL